MGATVVLGSNGKKVDYMIYTDKGEYKLLEQSEELGLLLFLLLILIECSWKVKQYELISIRVAKGSL